MADTPNTLTQALLPFIDKAQQGLDKGISFLSDQIPDIIQQLLLWKGISSFLLWFLVGFLPIMCLIILDYKFFKWTQKPIQKESTFTNADNHEDMIALFILGNIILYAIFGAFFICNWNWIQILIAPKVYLLEYAASLIK